MQRCTDHKTHKKRWQGVAYLRCYFNKTLWAASQGNPMETTKGDTKLKSFGCSSNEYQHCSGCKTSRNRYSLASFSSDLIGWLGFEAGSKKLRSYRIAERNNKTKYIPRLITSLFDLITFANKCISPPTNMVFCFPSTIVQFIHVPQCSTRWCKFQYERI